MVAGISLAAASITGTGTAGFSAGFLAGTIIAAAAAVAVLVLTPGSRSSG